MPAGREVLRLGVLLLLLAVAVLGCCRLGAIALLSGWGREVLLVGWRGDGAVGGRVVARVTRRLALGLVRVLPVVGGGSWELVALIVGG